MRTAASPQASAKFRGGKGGEGAGASKYPSRQLLLVSLRTSSLPEQPATLWVAAGWRRGQNTQQRVLWVGVGGESRVYLATWLLLVPAEPVLVAFPAASSKPATSRGSTRRCRATAATGSPPLTAAPTSTREHRGAATLPPPTHPTPHPPPSPMSQSLMP